MESSLGFSPCSASDALTDAANVRCTLTRSVRRRKSGSASNKNDSSRAVVECPRQVVIVGESPREGSDGAVVITNRQRDRRWPDGSHHLDGTRAPGLDRVSAAAVSRRVDRQYETGADDRKVFRPRPRECR